MCTYQRAEIGVRTESYGRLLGWCLDTPRFTPIDSIRVVSLNKLTREKVQSLLEEVQERKVDRH